MELFEYIRKAMLAGMGMQDKVKELVDELVEKGELKDTEGAKFLKELSNKADKNKEDISSGFSEMMSKTLKKMNIPTKEDLDKLNKKVSELSRKIKKLEQSTD